LQSNKWRQTWGFLTKTRARVVGFYKWYNEDARWVSMGNQQTASRLLVDALNALQRHEAAIGI